MALRGGVAVGGDRHLLPAAAGAAGAGGAADGVADPGAVRPAGGPRGGGAVRAVRGGDPRLHPRRGRPGAARGRPRRPWRASWSAPGATTSARSRASSAAAARPAGCVRAPRAVDLLGHPRGAAAAGDRGGAARCRRRAASSPTARASAQGWRGGFWLPECAHAGYLEPTLADAGVHAVCVELTGRLGLGAPAHLRPLVGESGVVLVPIDRATIARVWSDAGLPRARALPRLPPGTPSTTTTRGPTTATPTTTGRPSRSRGSTRRTSWRAPASGCAATARACPGAAWWCARWTPSCSATGGMRASRG